MITKKYKNTKKGMIVTVIVSAASVAAMFSSLDEVKENINLGTTVSDALTAMTQPSVAEAETVRASVGDPSIESLKNLKQLDFVKDFGADPTGQRDSSEAYDRALEKATVEPFQLNVPAGTYLHSPTGKNIEAFGIKGLKIVGAGKDKVIFKSKNPRINKPEWYFTRAFMAKDNIGFEVTGITVDGSLDPQDQFFTMGTPNDFYNTVMSKGFHVVGAKKASFHDMGFQHMYGGYSIHMEDWDKLNIKNVLVDDVGGEDITDSFGMAVYLSGHTSDNAIANIDNLVFNGKVGSKSPEHTSWIGVVFENGTIQGVEANWLRDKNTTVNITNSSFKNVETGIHFESTYGNAYLNVDNLYLKAKDYFIGAGINGEMKTRTNKLTFDHLPFGRNGIVKGIYYTEKESADNISGKNTNKMYNSTINYISVPGYADPYMATSYGDNVRAEYYNTTFNNVPNLLVTNASGTFVDSAINLKAGNNKTKEQLQNGDFNDRDKQFVKFVGNTTINPAGSHKVASQTTAPAWLSPTGAEIKPIEEPIKPPADIGTTPTTPPTTETPKPTTPPTTETPKPTTPPTTETPKPTTPPSNGTDTGLSVSGKAFADTDSTNSYNATKDVGIKGVKVELLNGMSQVVAKTVTDAQGNYKFDNLKPGSYYVMFYDNGYSSVIGNIGDDNFDSDGPIYAMVTLKDKSVNNVFQGYYMSKDTATKINGGTTSTTPPTTETPKPTTELPTTELPTTPPTTEVPKPTTPPTTETPKPTTPPSTVVSPNGYKVTGYAFADIDGTNSFNKERDKGVKGIGVVLLDGMSREVAKAVTDADGKYTFEGVKPGNYNMMFYADGLSSVIANIADDNIDSDGPIYASFTVKDKDVTNVFQGYYMNATQVQTYNSKH